MSTKKKFEHVFKREETLKILREAGEKGPEMAEKILARMGIDTVYLGHFQTMCLQKCDDVVLKIEERVFPEILGLPLTERKQWLLDHKVYSAVIRAVRVEAGTKSRMIYVLYCPENRLLGIDKTIKRCWFIDVKPIYNPAKVDELGRKVKDKILLQVEEIEQKPFPKWIIIKEEKKNG